MEIIKSNQMKFKRQQGSNVDDDDDDDDDYDNTSTSNNRRNVSRVLKRKSKDDDDDNNNYDDNNDDNDEEEIDDGDNNNYVDSKGKRKHHNNYAMYLGNDKVTLNLESTRKTRTLDILVDYINMIMSVVGASIMSNTDKFNLIVNESIHRDTNSIFSNDMYSTICQILVDIVYNILLYNKILISHIKFKVILNDVNYKTFDPIYLKWNLQTTHIMMYINLTALNDCIGNITNISNTTVRVNPTFILNPKIVKSNSNRKDNPILENSDFVYILIAIADHAATHLLEEIEFNTTDWLSHEKFGTTHYVTMNSATHIVYSECKDVANDLSAQFRNQPYTFFDNGGITSFSNADIDIHRSDTFISFDNFNKFTQSSSADCLTHNNSLAEVLTRLGQTVQRFRQ